MNALTLRADLVHGQKTSIFLDQRDNYRTAARYARGGKALDCFTSTLGDLAHPTVMHMITAAHRYDRPVVPAGSSIIPEDTYLRKNIRP